MYFYAAEKERKGKIKIAMLRKMVGSRVWSLDFPVLIHFLLLLPRNIYFHSQSFRKEKPQRQTHTHIRLMSGSEKLLLHKCKKKILCPWQ